MKRQWTHKSVKSLMRLEGGEDPEEIIRAKARAAVSNARERGWTGPPYKPLLLASLLGIKTRKAKGIFSEEAQLRPVDGKQLLLEFNPERAAVRQNYSVCHEIAHTFFPDCFEMVRYRRSNPREFDPEKEVEDLCQVGASELLMPLVDFQYDLAETGFSLSSVPKLAERFEASREATVRRMVSLTSICCAVVFLSEHCKPAELRQLKDSPGKTAPSPKMRVIRATGSDDFPVYIPAHKSVPDDSCVNRANLIDYVVSDVEQWNLPGFGFWKIEAMGVPVPPNVDSSCPTVLALIQAS